MKQPPPDEIPTGCVLAFIGAWLLYAFLFIAGFIALVVVLWKLAVS